MGRWTVVWDWNGTLLDDRAVLLDAVRDTLHDDGSLRMSDRELLERFDRPLRRFFERARGRPLADRDWERVHDCFRRHYQSRMHEPSLVTGAREALARGGRIAAGQFLLSLAPHDDVLRLARVATIDDCFTEMRGRTMPHEDKLSLLTDLIQRRALDPAALVHVGDSLDDAEAARAVGATPILVTGSSLESVQPERQSRLQPLVASTLGDAVDLIADLG